jgi:hypothetical protein
MPCQFATKSVEIREFHAKAQRRKSEKALDWELRRAWTVDFGFMQWMMVASHTRSSEFLCMAERPHTRPQAAEAGSLVPEDQRDWSWPIRSRAESLVRPGSFETDHDRRSGTGSREGLHLIIRDPIEPHCADRWDQGFVTKGAL